MRLNDDGSISDDDERTWDEAPQDEPTWTYAHPKERVRAASTAFGYADSADRERILREAAVQIAEQLMRDGYFVIKEWYDVRSRMTFGHCMLVFCDRKPLPEG